MKKLLALALCMSCSCARVADRQPDAAPRRAAGGRVAQDATIRAAWLQEGPMFVLPTLHGRDPELQELAELLQPGSQEQPVLWLEGPAGVGKSALINAWASRLRRGDALVLTSQCEGAGDDAMQLLERLLSRAQDPAGRAGTTAPARVAARIQSQGFRPALPSPPAEVFPAGPKSPAQPGPGAAVQRHQRPHAPRPGLPVDRSPAAAPAGPFPGPAVRCARFCTGFAGQ